MLSKLDFIAWLSELSEQDGKVFVPGHVCNCPVAQYASARSGKDCWASYDEIWPVGGDIMLRADWVLDIIKRVDASQADQLSAKEVLALV